LAINTLYKHNLQIKIALGLHKGISSYFDSGDRHHHRSLCHLLLVYAIFRSFWVAANNCLHRFYRQINRLPTGESEAKVR